MNQETSPSPASDSEDDEVSLLDLLQVVVENLRLLVLGPIAAGLLALGVSYQIPPTYTAKTVFMPPQQQQGGAALMMQSLGALGGLAGAAAGIKNPTDQFLAFLKSESVADGMVDRFDLVARYRANLRVDARASLGARSRFSSGKDGLILLEVDDTDPVFAADMANGYVKEFSKLLGRMAVTEAQQRRAFFEKQLLEVAEKLKSAEMALQDSGVALSALKSSPEATMSRLAVLQGQVTAQEIRLGSMRGYLAESAPEFKQGLADLAAMRAALTKIEQASATSSKGGSEYLGHYRDFKYYQTLFELFSKQFELAKIDEAREGAVIQVLDVARPPERKSKPNKAELAVITALAVGFLLLLFVFIRNVLRQTGADLESREKLSRLSRAWSKAIGR
jgi:tyrosine-protein kinase Etk/Wzc